MDGSEFVDAKTPTTLRELFSFFLIRVFSFFQLMSFLEFREQHRIFCKEKADIRFSAYSCHENLAFLLFPIYRARLRR